MRGRALSTETTPEFKTDAIGKWGEPVSFEVERERIQAYAAATNDTIAAHVAGDVAPPVFAIVPTFQAMGQASLGVIPGELLGMILHGEQDFHFQKPIEPGMTLATRAKAIGLRPRSSGVTVSVLGETRDSTTEELLVSQYMTSFVRGASGPEALGDEAPKHGFDDSLRERDPDATVDQTFDADQTLRYSEASGDPMPIHLDDDFAKKMGLPGIIIHVLCTMAFTSVATIEHACPDDPTRLKRLAVRFAKIVLPEQTITTRIWDAGETETEGTTGYAYETTADSGEVIIKDGWAEVA
ncbi:MaoC/PaaZ C-terminal domain-containing protein [soil metagenome]